MKGGRAIHYRECPKLPKSMGKEVPKEVQHNTYYGIINLKWSMFAPKAPNYVP